MDDTIKTLKKARSQALDAGVKNCGGKSCRRHAQPELVELIEQAGPEFVGATIDTGNSTWTWKTR